MEKLSKILDEFLEKKDLKKKILYNDLILNWKNFVGEGLATHIQPKNVKNKILLLYSDHPVWSENFKIMQNEVKKRINEHYKTDLIDDFKIMILRKDYGRNKRL
ncbi:MAG: DUF721 domain-containing protein [Caldisericia bacterium]